MEKVVTAIIISLGTVVMLGVLVCLGTLVGGVTGWIVGGIFNDSIAQLKLLIGTTATNFELGAMLGFAGGFFRGISTKS